MALIFADSSAVVKRYVQETGSMWVSGLFTAAPANEITVVALTGVEVVAAITRRARGGTISPADAASSCALFLADLGPDYAVQLAAANEVNRLRVTAGAAPIIFVSADQELNAAARSEGLAVDDPNAHP